MNSDGVLRALTDRGLIEEAGREEAPGRLVLYATTPGFLERLLGFPSAASLPSLAPLLDPSTEDEDTLAKAVTDQAELDDAATHGPRATRNPSLGERGIVGGHAAGQVAEPPPEG